MSIKFKLPIIIIAIIAVISCKKSRETESHDTSMENDLVYNEISQEHSSSIVAADFHTITVNEVMDAAGYIYLNVTEDNKDYWVATVKRDINLGDTYYYKEGLLQVNFESREYKKVFDTIYLLQDLLDLDQIKKTKNSGKSLSKEEKVHNHSKVERNANEKIIEIKGSIKISELINNSKKYENTTVQISGECVKVNEGIMNKNWIHLIDGTQGSYDLIVTSDALPKVGEIITMTAKVILNKDFGAGYSYELILEEGEVLE